MNNINNIIKLLHIEDDGIRVIDMYDKGDSRTIIIERIPDLHYCPFCGCRMYSKGIRKRTIKHQILQDGYKLFLEIHQRRWMCNNPECKEIVTDQFSFVDPRRRTTNLSDILIVNAFKDMNKSASQIAREFNVSTSHAITTFSRYVDMPRRQLPETLCVDEVYIGTSTRFKYALVLQDFVNNEPVDLVISRRQEITEPYFMDIPYNERARVKYIVSDMYRPYQAYCREYFPNAKPVIDSFHVLQLINWKFLQYIRTVLKRIDTADRARHEVTQQSFHRELPFRHSKDYLVLKHYNWMLLKNQQHLKVYTKATYNSLLGRYMNTFDYFEWMFKLDKNFDEMRDLREKYASFNVKYAGNPEGARKALPAIIAIYKSSKFEMYRQIAATLEEYFEPIILSFTLVRKHTKAGEYDSRISNGPIECLNRYAKDLKRNGRGYTNFEHMRNRFLFAKRRNATILGQPKTLKQVYAEMPERKNKEYIDPYLLPETDDDEFCE